MTKYPRKVYPNPQGGESDDPMILPYPVSMDVRKGDKVNPKKTTYEGGLASQGVNRQKK